LAAAITANFWLDRVALAPERKETVLPSRTVLASEGELVQPEACRVALEGGNTTTSAPELRGKDVVMLGKFTFTPEALCTEVTTVNWRPTVRFVPSGREPTGLGSVINSDDVAV
jgi:hypothetical protein